MPIVPVSSDIPTMNNQNFQENINHVPTEAEVSPSRPESPEIAENFEPELEEENNGTFYCWGFKAFPQSQILENGKTSQLLRYFSGDYLTGLPTHNDIVAENDEGLTVILQETLSKRGDCKCSIDIPFMAVDFEGSSEKISEKNHYILRLYGSLINGQKAVVTLTGIQIFFDILIPDSESVDEFKIKIDEILCNTINIYKIEHIKAFPFHEKKSYLRIFTLGTGDRKKALQAIQDKNYETASDDMYSFHCKIARENGIAISGWSMIIEDPE
ncbi:11944_t:CDS:2 [Entrophospora sp. SA101]|nr:11944_t:CDS:2 [Entrophospora sp. SA101]